MSGIGQLPPVRFEGPLAGRERRELVVAHPAVFQKAAT